MNYDFFMFVIAILSFIYGAWALLTATLFPRDLKGIAEKHKRLYARLVGIALLLNSAVSGTTCYLGRTEQPEPPFLLIFIFISVIIMWAAQKKCKKRD